MSSIAVSRPINPAGKAPLTQDQVWKGLGVKAREPLKFVKMIKACEVVEDETTKVVRNVEFHNGKKITETIHLYEPTIAYFEAGSSSDLRVTNLISWLNGELHLTYTFVNGVPGFPEIKDAKEVAEKIGESIDHGLEQIRELVKSGEIA